jgi:Spy/CpxP family protein refolding chaperone
MVLWAMVCIFPATVLADDSDRYRGPPCDMMGGMGMGMGMGMGPGMGMGNGMMGGGMGMMSMGPYHMLDLTADQRTKANKIQDDLRRKHWETMGKIMDEQARLRDLYDADKRDNAAILKVHDQIDQLHRKMREAHLGAESQIEALLTKEQRDQLKQMRRGGPRGMGMGPGGTPNAPRGMMMR